MTDPIDMQAREGWTRATPDGSVGGCSITAMLDQRARSAPDDVAVVFEGSQTTFGQLRERSGRFAAALRDLGVGPGSRVLLWLTSGPSWIQSYLAVARLGATAVPVNPRYTNAEALAIIAQAVPVVVLLDERDDLPWILAALEETEGLLSTERPVVIPVDTDAAKLPESACRPGEVGTIRLVLQP